MVWVTSASLRQNLREVWDQRGKQTQVTKRPVMTGEVRPGLEEGGEVFHVQGKQ